MIICQCTCTRFKIWSMKRYFCTHLFAWILRSKLVWQEIQTSSFLYCSIRLSRHLVIWIINNLVKYGRKFQNFAFSHLLSSSHLHVYYLTSSYSKLVIYWMVMWLRLLSNYLGDCWRMGREMLWIFVVAVRFSIPWSSVLKNIFGRSIVRVHVW